MIEGGRRHRAAFGRRRDEDRPQIDDAGPGSGVDGDPPSATPRGTLSWALRMAALLGFGALVAIRLLAHPAAPDGAAGTRVARSPSAVPVDPETTGSIGEPTRPGGSDFQATPVPPRCRPLVACLQAPRSRPGP